jgi:hypothetical protein
MSMNIIRFLIEHYYDIQLMREKAYNNIVAYVVQHPELKEALEKKVEEVKIQNSQARNESQKEDVSHAGGETHKVNVSHGKSETHGSHANQIDFETHGIDVSQTNHETHEVNADLEEEENEEESEEEKRPKEIADYLIAGKIEAPNVELETLIWYYKSLYSTEKNLAVKLDGWSREHPLRKNYLSKIRGIGPILSSGIIAWLSPIERFSNISKLWAYCGLSAVHYESECEEGHKIISSSPLTVCPVRVKKGDKIEVCGAKILKSEKVNSPPKRKVGYFISYNQKLKTFMWKVASSFVKQPSEKSIYRKLYEEKKAYYTNRPDLAKDLKEGKKGAKAHVNAMAMRFVEKRFLADLWVYWRTMEGLPVTKPYAIDIMKHADYEPPRTDK